MNKYHFRITLKNSPLYDKHPSRDLEILPEKSLYSFAEEITYAFDFALDHCFGFYDDNILKMYDSKEIFELFVDLPDVEQTPGAKSKNTRVVRKYMESPEQYPPCDE